MDVSADLTELGRTPVAVICAGAKSILDIPRTLEYLETQACFPARIPSHCHALCVRCWEHHAAIMLDSASFTACARPCYALLGIHFIFETLTCRV